MTYDFLVNRVICQKSKLRASCVFSAAEFVKKFGELCDEALARPVIITRHGRDRLVVMSLAIYRGLGGAPDLAKQAGREHTIRPSANRAASGRAMADGRREIRRYRRLSETEVMTGSDQQPLALIVGIGASAGGLEAFAFFAHMPADTGMAFVLVQHLDPRAHEPAGRAAAPAHDHAGRRGQG